MANFLENARVCVYVRSIRNVRFEYHVVEPKTGVKGRDNPVIFLHGMLCSKETWSTIPRIVANSTGRRVYVYDARNHGNSDHSANSCFDNNVKDLFEFMTLVKVDANYDVLADQVILVGYDMGGMTAIHAALALPEKFEEVIVIEMYTKKVPDVLINRSKIFMTKWAECVRKVPKNMPNDITKYSIEKLFKKLPRDIKENYEKSSYLNAKFLYDRTESGYDVPYNTEYLSTALDEMKGMQDPQGKYDNHAYFFYGEKSHLNIGNEKDAIKQLFPQAKFVEFEGGSHFFVADVPDKVASELSKIINEISVTRSTLNVERLVRYLRK